MADSLPVNQAPCPLRRLACERKNRVAGHGRAGDTGPMNTNLSPDASAQALAVRPAYRVRPISADFLRRVREQGLDDLGQPVEHHIAQGGEPCRDVLRRAHPGEALILASHCPLALPGPYREFGPVFVRATAGESTLPLSALPLQGPQPYLGTRFVLRAYSAQERIVDGQVVEAHEAEALLLQQLDRAEVAFVLARFAGYGCFAARIERA